jgi:hypothetical protein
VLPLRVADCVSETAKGLAVPGDVGWQRQDAPNVYLSELLGAGNATNAADGVWRRLL